MMGGSFKVHEMQVLLLTGRYIFCARISDTAIINVMGWMGEG